MSLVSLQRDGIIGVIRIDNPPVNALSFDVRQGIIDCVGEAAQDPAIKALVIACAGRTFIAGADITEFGKPSRRPGFPEMIEALETSPKLIVAAMFGTAFGGGLELAHACHYRMAVASAKLGLPEVKLGILPGGGGTQRLPRLAGVERALDMIVSGDPVSASEAFEAGIVDQLHQGDGPLDAAAVAYATALVEAGAPLRRVRDLGTDAQSLSADFFDQARDRVAKSHRGLFAPQRCIDAVEAAATLPFDEGIAKERALFMACAANPQSRALQHAFFAERKAAKIADLGKDVRARPVSHIGIIGAGTMGGGIAMACLNAGYRVILVDREDAALDRGLATMRANYGRAITKGRMTEADLDHLFSQLTPATDLAALGGCDLIIEAVFENMAVKENIFRALGQIAKPGAIVASNTSYLDINRLAQISGRPADVLGLHFFSPANIMKLLEIVRGRATADDVLMTASALGKRLGKISVLAGVCHGFIGNRMLEGYGREAGLLLLEGATPAQVDAAIRAFGYPMGPFAMADLAGLDIGHSLRSAAPPGRFDDHAYRVHGRLVAADRLGQKTGAGFYRYEPADRTPYPDPLVAQITHEEAEKAGISARHIDEQDIVERCLLPLVNEGARILEEGIAQRASDIDVTYLYGYGFPRWRGGPMFWADSIGLDKVVARIEAIADQQGERWWQVAPLLAELAHDGRSFKDWDQGR